MISFVHITKKALISCLLALSLLGQSCLASGFKSFMGRHKIAAAGGLATVLLVGAEVHHAYKKAKKESAAEAKKNNTKPKIKSFWDFAQDLDLCKKHIRASRIGAAGVVLALAAILDWRKNRPQPQKDEQKQEEEELTEDQILATFQDLLQQEMNAVQAVERVQQNDPNAAALQMRDFTTKPADLIRYSTEYLQPQLQGTVENDIKEHIAKYVEAFLTNIRAQQEAVAAETNKVRQATQGNQAMSDIQARWTPRHKHNSWVTEMQQHLGDTSNRSFYTQDQYNDLNQAIADYEAALQAYVNAYIANITSQSNPDARRFDRQSGAFKKFLEDTFGIIDQHDQYKTARSAHIEHLLQEQEDAAIQEMRAENQDGHGNPIYTSHIWNDAVAKSKVRAAAKHFRRISGECEAQYFNDASLQRYKEEFKKYIRCMDMFMSAIGGWQAGVNYDVAQHHSLNKVQAALVDMVTCYTYELNKKMDTLCDIFVKEICCAYRHVEHGNLGTVYDTMDIPHELEYMKTLVKPLVYFNTEEFVNPNDRSKNIFNHARIAFVQAIYERSGQDQPALDTVEAIQAALYQAVQLDHRLKFSLVGSGFTGGGKDILAARMVCKDPMDSDALVGVEFDHIYGEGTDVDKSKLWRPYTTDAAKVAHNLMNHPMMKLFVGVGKSVVNGLGAGLNLVRRLNPFSR